MLGFFRRKRAGTDDVQIPYQVYETVHEPAIRRQRWMIRLAAVLLAVTLVMLALTLFRNRDEASTGSNGPSSQISQPPQTNPLVPQSTDQPVRTPASDVTNDKTISQPQ